MYINAGKVFDDTELEILNNSDGSKWIHPDQSSTCDFQKGEAPKFKVGDRVRVTKTENSWEQYVDNLDEYIGKIGVVEMIDIKPYSKSDGISARVKFEDDTWDFAGSWLEKTENESLTTTSSEPLTINTETIQKAMDTLYRQMVDNRSFMNCPMYVYDPYKLNYALSEAEPNDAPKKGFIMNAVDKLKRLALSKEDRILQDEGLEDENGNMTPEARAMIYDEQIQTVWASRRKEIAADLLKLKSEECKK